METVKTMSYSIRPFVFIIGFTLSAMLPYFTVTPDVVNHQKLIKASNFQPILLSGSATITTWRKLVRGMSKCDVRELFGEPDRIVKRPSFEVWYYPPASGRVLFDDFGRVYGWDEPS
ncbi:MAG: hypothetical protein NTZ46_02905 [Verrucomicrobia bacterium]|nr:hypothetical protein [Verrucomicrobiota bacterium]